MQPDLVGSYKEGNRFSGIGEGFGSQNRDGKGIDLIPAGNIRRPDKGVGVGQPGNFDGEEPPPGDGGTDGYPVEGTPDLII
jgi:hypothetical protein